MGAFCLAVWSNEGLAIADRHNLTAQDLDKTYLVVFGGQPLTKSDATFTIFKTLHAPWRWVTLLSILPRSFRDRFYDLMAKNRYRWFGQKDQCFTSSVARLVAAAKTSGQELETLHLSAVGRREAVQRR